MSKKGASNKKSTPMEKKKNPQPPQLVGMQGNRGPSKEERAGLQFSVSRCGRFLRKGRYAERLGAGAPVYMAAVAEYLLAEILEIAGGKTQEEGRHLITPKILAYCVKGDEELNKVFGENTVFHEGGKPPIGINATLLSKKQKKELIQEGVDINDPSQNF